MSDEKYRVQLKITRELIADLERFGLGEDDILAVVTGKFESDEQARRITALIEADSENAQ